MILRHAGRAMKEGGCKGGFRYGTVIAMDMAWKQTVVLLEESGRPVYN